MPHFYDFENLRSVKTIDVDADGWINPLAVEYGIDDEDLPSLCWRVKGTKHTFTIPVGRIDYLSGGDYGKHFKTVLEGFREDYIGWKRSSNTTDWMQGYFNEYSRFIVV
jgi:hypothetical protein